MNAHVLHYSMESPIWIPWVHKFDGKTCQVVWQILYAMQVWEWASVAKEWGKKNWHTKDNQRSVVQDEPISSTYLRSPTTKHLSVKEYWRSIKTDIMICIVVFNSNPKHNMLERKKNVFRHRNSKHGGKDNFVPENGDSINRFKGLNHGYSVNVIHSNKFHMSLSLWNLHYHFWCFIVTHDLGTLPWLRTIMIHLPSLYT